MLCYQRQSGFQEYLLLQTDNAFVKDKALEEPGAPFGMHL